MKSSQKTRRRRPLPDNALATITQLSDDGRGITHINGKVTFVFGALPGETVLFRYHRTHGSFDEGIALSVAENPSPARVIPPCPAFSLCGGCSLQHINPLYQIQHKEKTLMEWIKRTTGKMPPRCLPPMTGPTTQYRYKARLGARFLRDKDKFCLGFRERFTRFVTPLTQCAVLVPSIGQHIGRISDVLTTLDNRDHIPQIEVASGDTQIALIIRHMQPFSETDLSRLIQLAQELSVTLYLQPKGPDTVHPLWPVCPEPLSYTLPDYQLTYQFHPLAFTQVNPAINRQLIPHAVALLNLQPEDQVLDLFCGLGNFTLPMARFAKHVTGVEGDEKAVQQARRNAAYNQISNTDFYVENLFEPKAAEWLNTPYTKVLLDPPRSGAQEIIPYLSRWPLERIVYVSCNPATLARDLALLETQGFSLEAAGVLDMFPHTDHVESIAVLCNTKI
ncbi:MAG: hypothetical protein A3J38_07230 [Gammaproteobacteria bacterium RIFCSPHIGHO2_12_FULL_45_9]|nr:MAG: hypothetical protein A3J38_07230 [Gammaproteobacteria bacterium RIFCSPHIGHO2_12_FULL_45_9]